MEPSIKSFLPFKLGGKKENNRDHFQYRLLQQFGHSSCYRKLMENFDKDIIILENTSLNHQFYATRTKSLMKRYGKPLYNISHKHGEHRFRILFYKQIIEDQKVRLEFHFCDDKLFYYSYTFPYLSDEEKNKFMDQIGKKYGLDQTDLKVKCIEDPDGIRLHLSDSLGLCLKYLDNNAAFLDLLKHHRFNNGSTRSSISKKLNDLSHLF
jgi:hypothetical protein